MNALAQLLQPWCRHRLEERRRAKSTWVLGIQGPQGAGKSTAAAALVECVRHDGGRAVCVSIDDFYLTHAEQRALAERHPGNPCLRYRGYPGTHDVALGDRVIAALASAEEGTEVRVPVYDKSAHGGRGDRAPESAWRRVGGPFDLVIVEGWMLGFPPVGQAALEPELADPNRYLAAYRAWNDRLDAMVHLGVESPATIVEWRVQSERARRARGETALSDDDATDYIRRFLPAYRVYVPALRMQPPCADFFAVALGPDRAPISPPAAEA
jgi:D-glycerate 3-kinase